MSSRFGKGYVPARPEYREEVRAFHRSLYKGWKESVGVNGPADVEWWKDSLQRLLDQGWCLADIACFVGVTGERVRQWCKRFDLEPPHGMGTTPRVWDPDKQMFRAVSTAEFAKRRRRRAAAKAAAKRKAEWRAYRRAKRDEHRRALCELHRQLGYTPSHRDLMDALGHKAYGQIARHWVHKMEGNYTQATRRLYRSCGLEPRPTGSPGHAPDCSCGSCSGGIDRNR